MSGQWATVETTDPVEPLPDEIDEAIEVIDRYVECRHMSLVCFDDCTRCPHNYDPDELTKSLELVIRYLKQE